MVVGFNESSEVLSLYTRLLKWDPVSINCFAFIKAINLSRKEVSLDFWALAKLINTTSPVGDKGKIVVYYYFVWKTDYHKGSMRTATMLTHAEWVALRSMRYQSVFSNFHSSRDRVSVHWLIELGQGWQLNTSSCLGEIKMDTCLEKEWCGESQHLHSDRRSICSEWASLSNFQKADSYT